MKRLDFIGVGPPKTGSTWIADNLRKHPEVFLPSKKELEYFNKSQYFYWDGPNPNYGKSLKWYHAFFKDADPQKTWGEITVRYFEAENCPQDIFEYNPDVKIIISLRNPISKALSFFRYGQQHGKYDANSSFEETINEDDYLLRNSLYAEGLKRYFNVYPKNQILVVFQDDLKADARAFFKQVTDFLGLTEFYPEDIDKRSNVTVEIKRKGLSKVIVKGRQFIVRNNLTRIVPVLRSLGIIQLIKLVHRNLNYGKAVQSSASVEISDELRGKLLSYFHNDICEVERLTGKELSSWKS